MIPAPPFMTETPATSFAIDYAAPCPCGAIARFRSVGQTAGSTTRLLRVEVFCEECPE